MSRPSLYLLFIAALIWSGLAGCSIPAVSPTLPPASPDVPTDSPSPLPASPSAPTISPSAPPGDAKTQAAIWPAQGWPRATPEQQGLDSAQLAQAFAFIQANSINLHSLLVIRNGHLVVEAYFSIYHSNTRHVLYSCTKSFIATLVGIAMDQGYLTSVDQPVLNFFPDQDFANPDPRKEALNLEDFLTMTSGLKWTEDDVYPMYSSRDWVRFMLDRPLETTPGSQFNYCSGCSHLLAAILQQATQTKLMDFARANLFTPLGITDLEWETDPGGLPIGGWGLQLTPRDMAKLGYLYLNEGTWDGKQIVSAGWVQRAVTKHITTGGDLDYGYQWWVDPAGRAYAALGLNGQTIFVVPEYNLLIVNTADEDGHDAIFELIEQYILPAVRSPQALPANPAAEADLEAQIEAAGGH